MNFKVPVLVCFATFISLNATSTIKCPKNKEYTDCGSMCPKTCNSPPNRLCPDRCVSGCFCRGDLVEDSNGVCIPEEDCKRSEDGCDECEDDEVFKECGNECESACDSKDPSVNCTEVSRTGCFCPEGTYRHKISQRCIPIEECIRCPENQHWTPYGTACPETCPNHEKKTPCSTLNFVQGCFCKDGFVLDRNLDKCVEPSKCSQCPKNKVYQKCGTACPLTCENPEIGPCTKQCVPGCFCRSGYLRDKNGKCVAPKQCECPRGEIFSSCGTACPPTCNSTNTVVCTLQCVSGCFCPNGQVRNDTGSCVPNSECKQQQCGKFEQYKQCGTTCESTCKVPSPSICNKMCKAGCFCKDGYIRIDENKTCISKTDCKKH